MAKDYSVNVLGLSKSVHQFDFQLSEDFFKKYGQEVVANGNFEARVSLDKRETFIEADFTVKGSAHLVCDRSLDEFDFPVSIHKKVVFKYGEVPQEVSDEIVIITPDQDKLDLGQLMYEFIALQIPMKKLHPRYSSDDKDKEGLVYTSANKADDETIDPRWEVLKKLKK
ncbi:DNA-binding protein [Cytophagales bacterium WSM2-2]|nr:DNA-binding protein [Cytophagales bacterium WSM2-2]